MERGRYANEKTPGGPLRGPIELFYFFSATPILLSAFVA